MDFAAPVDNRVKIKENKKRGNYVNLAWEIRKLWNMKVKVIAIVINALGVNLKHLERGLEELEIGRRIETSLKIGQNNENSPGDLRRLAITQSPVKKHHLTMLWKTLKK